MDLKERIAAAKENHVDEDQIEDRLIELKGVEFVETIDEENYFAIANVLRKQIETPEDIEAIDKIEAGVFSNIYADDTVLDNAFKIVVNGTVFLLTVFKQKGLDNREDMSPLMREVVMRKGTKNLYKAFLENPVKKREAINNNIEKIRERLNYFERELEFLDSFNEEFVSEEQAEESQNEQQTEESNDEPQNENSEDEQINETF